LCIEKSTTGASNLRLKVESKFNFSLGFPNLGQNFNIFANCEPEKSTVDWPPLLNNIAIEIGFHGGKKYGMKKMET
jgi:hypothetical protein